MVWNVWYSYLITSIYSGYKQTIPYTLSLALTIYWLMSRYWLLSYETFQLTNVLCIECVYVLSIEAIRLVDVFCIYNIRLCINVLVMEHLVRKYNKMSFWHMTCWLVSLKERELVMAGKLLVLIVDYIVIVCLCK